MKRINLSTVFIWAPTTRNGTGLLQRLITSSGQVLVCGEEQTLFYSLPTTVIERIKSEKHFESRLQELAEAPTQAGWVPDAVVPGRHLVESTAAYLHDIDLNYRKYSETLGYDRWGTKMPAFDREVAQFLSRAIPGSQHVFIFRDLADCVRSAKARGWVRGHDDVAKMSAVYKDAVKAARAWPALHIIQYEDLLENPDSNCKELCDFLGLDKIDMKVFANKTNNFSQYKPPAALTKAERAAL